MQGSGTKKIWRWLARIGAVLIMGFFLLLISLPNLIDLDNYRPQLVDFLRSKCVGDVEVGKLELTFQHGPGLRVDGVKIFSATSAQHIVVATAIINFDFLHLLKRHLHLARLTLVRPDVVLIMDRGISPLTEFLKPSDSKGGKNLGLEAGTLKLFGGWVLDCEISGALVEIVDGSVECTDNRFCSSPITTDLEKLDAQFRWRKVDSQTEFRLNSKVKDDANYGSLKIEGTLSHLKFPVRPGDMILDCKIDAENLNGGNYFPYYQEYVPMRFIGGRVDIDANYDGSLLGLFHSKGQIVLHQAELDYQQVFQKKLKFKRFALSYDFRLADSYNTIETRDCTINADGLIIKGYCLLSEARRGIDGFIDAKLSSSKFTSAKALYLIPWRIIPEEIHDYCKQLQSGSLIVESAYIKGDYRKITRLVDKNPPSGILGGKAHCEKLMFSDFDGCLPLAVANADIKFAEDTLSINNLDLSVGKVLNCKSGSFSLQNIFHQVQTEISGYLRLDLLNLQPFLGRFIADIKNSSTNSESEELPFTLTSGSVAGEFALEGPLFQPEKMYWSGTFSGRDIGFKLAAIPGSFIDGSGTFNLSDDLFSLDSVKLNYVGVPLTLSGTLPGPGFFFRSADTVATDFDFKVASDGDVPDEFNLLLNKSFNLKGLHLGSTSFEMNLRAARKDLSDLHFEIKGEVDELGLPEVTSSKNSKDKNLWRNLYNLDLSLAGGKGEPVNIRKCRWEWGVERAPVEVAGSLQIDDGLRGTIEAEVSDIDLDALLNVSSVSTDSLAQQKSLTAGGSQDPVKLVVLDEISEVLEDDEVASLIALKPLLERNDLSIKLYAHHLWWQQMNLDEVTCEGYLSDEGIHVGKLEGKSFDGDFNLFFGWDYADDSFMLEVQLEEINFENLNDYLKNPDRGLPMLGGNGSVNLDLYWEGSTGESWKKSLDGDLDFKFFNGRLKRFSMIANVCSLLNLSQYAALHLPEISLSKGVPYRELTYKGLIVGGQLDFDKFDMKGPAFNLFGSGIVDIVDDLVDLKIGIQPLQTVDKLLASIPVLGYIITGDKKTFVVLPITVKGPFDSVEIKTHTVVGAGKKIGGMMQRFFNTPVRLLQMPGKFFNKFEKVNKQSGKKAVETVKGKDE